MALRKSVRIPDHVVAIEADMNSFAFHFVLLRKPFQRRNSLGFLLELGNKDSKRENNIFKTL